MNNTTDETRLNNAGANNESLQGFIVGANKRYLPFIQYTPTFEDTDYEAKEITFAYTYGQIVALHVEGSNEHTDLKLQATLYFKIDEPENILAGYLSNLQYNGISNSHVDIYFWYNGETIKIGFIGQYNTFTVSARILNPEENKTGVIANILIKDSEIPDTDSNKYAEGSITSNTEGLIPQFNNLNIYTESNDLPDFIYSPTSSEDTTIDLRPCLPGSIAIKDTFDYSEGAYNTYNVIAKNGSIIGTFQVRNGTKGDQGNPGVQGNTGAQGPKGASGEQGHPIFFTADYPMNIEGAVKGDILVYMGEDTSIGKIGDVFKLINIDTVEEEGEETEVQRWAYQGYNLRGPQGEILNAEGLIPVFRLVNITDADYPPMSYQKLQMSFDSFQNIIELGELRCRSIRTIYQVQGLADEDTYYTFRIEYTDGTNYDLKIQGSGGKGAYEAGRLINIDDDNKIHCEVPTVKHELIYSDENDELTTHQLLYQDALIVDNQQDFLQCKSPDNIETDVLASWQQFQAACYNNSYGNNMPEYGDGTYVSDSNYGYSRWYNDGGAVKNKVNSIEFNGYLMPYSKSSYIVESLIGTTSGNTTGDQIGFSIVNDSNAVARHFSTNKDVYYRNTLYDIYPSGSTGENSPKMPSEFAWVSVNQNNNTAKVIYWTGRVSSQGAESFPSGTVNVYSIANIKTSTGRHNRVLIGTETVTANSSVEASGYIGFINGVVTNSSQMSIAQLSDSSERYTGTIYIFGSVYDISTKKWYNSKIIDGNFSQKDAGNYWDKGYWLAPYLSELDTNSSGNAAVMKNLVSFDNGILTLKFGTASSTIEGADYNGSELKIDFKSKTYDFTPYSSSGKNPVTNIALPALPDYTTGSGVYDRNGNSVTPDLWSMFAGESKFMYNAFSYQNLYINCLKIIIDNLIFYVDKTSTDYGVWQLNNARTDYEKVYMTGGEADDPMSHFNGSRQSYNPITGKLFYNDGSKIYQIASDSKYTSGDNVAIDSNNAISALGYTLSGDNFYLKNVGGYNGGTVTSSHLSIQDVIGHLSKVTSIGNTYEINGDSEIYVRTISGTTEADRTVTFKNPNPDRVVTCSIIFNNISGSTVTPVFKSAAGNNVLRIMTDIESIPTASIAEYVCTYISAFGWVINGGTQKNVVQPNSN